MSLQLKSIISSWTLKTYFSFDIIFFVQGNKISNGINVFPIHILFSLVLFHTENKYIYIYIYIYIDIYGFRRLMIRILVTPFLITYCRWPLLILTSSHYKDVKRPRLPRKRRD